MCCKLIDQGAAAALDGDGQCALEKCRRFIERATPSFKDAALHERTRQFMSNVAGLEYRDRLIEQRLPLVDVVGDRGYRAQRQPERRAVPRSRTTRLTLR